jgi:hypothetical protein
MWRAFHAAFLLGLVGDQRAPLFSQTQRPRQNVSPPELVAYVETQTDGVPCTAGGNLDLIKQLIAGLPTIVENP